MNAPLLHRVSLIFKAPRDISYVFNLLIHTLVTTYFSSWNFVKERRMRNSAHKHSWFCLKGTFIIDVPCFLVIFVLPTYLVLLYNVPFFWAILDPPTYPNIGRY